jgi:hypothetical protein
MANVKSLIAAMVVSAVCASANSDETPTVALPEFGETGTVEFGGRASWTIPTAADVRSRVIQWLDARKPDPDVRAAVERLWPEGESASIENTDLLERVAESIALVDPAAKDLVDFTSRHRQEVVLPQFAYIANEELEPFVRNNLRLLLGRWLSQHRYFDESIAQLAGLNVEDVVDPASLLFYQAVNYHWLLRKADSAQAIAKLFERREDLPRRYSTIAMLMQADLAMLEDESLEHVSRRMNDITRRLDFGRPGKKTQDVENGVIASLDKIIEELEKQRQGPGSGPAGDGQGGGGPAGGIRSSGPAADSNIAQGKGPGNIDRKKIGSQSGWGDLPAKEREEALQQIGKDFPSHYRDIIESYFRKIAESE